MSSTEINPQIIQVEISPSETNTQILPSQTVDLAVETTSQVIEVVSNETNITVVPPTTVSTQIIPFESFVEITPSDRVIFASLKYELLTIHERGQSLFTLNHNLASESVTLLFLNGVKQLINLDYVVNNNEIHWLSKFILKPQHFLELYYYGTN